MIYVYGLLGTLAAAIFIGGRYLFYRYGRNNERLKNAQSTIDKIRKGNDAASDSSYDDELRKKYDR